MITYRISWEQNKERNIPKLPKMRERKIGDLNHLDV